MDSICDAVYSALDQLKWKFQNQADIPLLFEVNQINIFEKEFRFLKLFLDWAHWWTDAEQLVPDLGSLVIKVQAKIHEIGSRILKKFKQTKNPFSKLLGKNKDLKALSLQWVDVLSSSIAAIESLKPEVMTVYSNPLVLNSFHSSKLCSDISDFSEWKNFVQSVKLIVKFLGFNAYPEIGIGHGFVNLLDTIIGFLDDLNGNGTNGREMVMHHVERIVIRAAFVFLKAWLVQMDQDKLKEMANVILDLGRQIDLSCSVEYVDVILEMVKTRMVPVRVFVDFIMGVKIHQLREEYAPIRDPCWQEMICLITYMTDTPRTLERFMGDLKILVMEAGALQDAPVFLQRITIMLNLLAKVRLLRMEIFLAEQLKVVDGNKVVIGFDLQKALLNWKKHHEFASNLTRADVLEGVMSIMKTIESEIECLNRFPRHQVIEVKMELVGLLFLKLFTRILLFKAELYLGLFRKNDTMMSEGIENLREGLKFLTMLINDLTEDVKLGKQHLKRIKTFSGGIISLCHSFPNGKVPEEMSQKTSLQIRSLQDELKGLMLYLRNMYLDVPWFNLPKAYPQDLVDKVWRNLKELLDFKSHLIAQMKHELEDVLGHLEFLKSLITGIQQQDKDVKEFKVYAASVGNFAYRVEYFIDTVVLGNCPNLKILLWIYDLLHDITHEKAKLEEIYVMQNLAQRVHSISDTTSQDIFRHYTPRSEEVVVDIGEDDFIIDRLIRGSSHQDIISIIGMPGIGKTTLATKAYTNVRTQYYFHIRAWCHVSQNYRKTELLLDILGQVNGYTENMIGMSDEDLEFKLYQCLKQRRYLIVMDDMWSTRAWEDLKRSLPDDHNGSRILITSRLHNVALKIKPDSDPHLMALLSDDRSWDLLQRKVFHEAECPAELVESGKLIASNCKGLPLSVVTIGGLLERTGKSLDFWNQIAENLSSHVLNDPQAQCMDVLSLSYNHLPNNLKVCFLYFSAFSGDKDIPVWRLICLWIAEGFIPEIGTKSLEEVAEDYLMELINRSLVTVAKPRSKGGVKSCRMHDLLHDLCRTKSKEEKFLNLANGIEDPYGYTETLGYGLDFGYNQMTQAPFRTCKTYNDHRLCIYSKRRQFIMEEPRGPYVRSLLFFALSDSYPRCPYVITFISDNFKLLKVLDLESLNMGSSFPIGIESLILLRYLALSGDIDSVPSTLAELCNLETLLVKGLKGSVVLPNTIWCMSRLRPLHITDLAMFDMEGVEVSQLDSLVSLSFVLLLQGKGSEIILRGLPNLRKLRCVFAEPQNTNEFPRLDLLTQPESLKIRYYGKALDTCVFNFPLNLKKLSLSNFCLPWNNISVIGKLPSLEVLKLSSRAFEGQEWEMTEGEFLKLKFLKMDTLNIVQWTASEDHLPNLEHLVLQSCKDLEGVPASFAYIPTLQVIQVKWCGRMVEESLKNIQDEEIEGLKIIINTKN